MTVDLDELNWRFMPLSRLPVHVPESCAFTDRLGQASVGRPGEVIGVEITPSVL